MGIYSDVRAFGVAKMSDGQRFGLTVLLALWAAAFGYAFVSYALTPPAGDGFVRGLNRVTAYLGWQGIAGMLSIPVFALGRAWPKGSPVRSMSRLPIGVAVAHMVVIVGVIVWAGF